MDETRIQEARGVFTLLDSDGDGFISCEDVRKSATECSQWTEHDLQRLCKDITKQCRDGDPGIPFQTFVQFITTHTEDWGAVLEEEGEHLLTVFGKGGAGHISRDLLSTLLGQGVDGLSEKELNAFLPSGSGKEAKIDLKAAITKLVSIYK